MIFSRRDRLIVARHEVLVAMQGGSVPEGRSKVMFISHQIVSIVPLGRDYFPHIPGTSCLAGTVSFGLVRAFSVGSRKSTVRTQLRPTMRSSPSRRPYAPRPYVPTPLFALGAVKDFVEEPTPVFSFVDPVLDQARGGNIVVLVAHVVSSAQILDQLLVVCQQIGQHGPGR
jgi:hypothetical protein